MNYILKKYKSTFLTLEEKNTSKVIVHAPPWEYGG